MRNLTKRHRSSVWRRYRALLIVAALAVSTWPVRAADMEVNIDNFAFTPKELTVKAGTTIVFHNRDDIPHSVVGSTGEFHSKALDTDDSFSFTFTTPGTYQYFCYIHPHMTGTIVVEAATGSNTTP